MVAPAERDQVRALAAFEGLSDADLNEIIAMASRQELTEGQILFTEDDPADSLFILLAGNVDLTVRGADGSSRIVAQLGSGASLGETSLLIGGNRSVSARATSAGTLLRFPHDAFREMIESGSLLAYRVVHNLARVLAARLRAADDLVADLVSGRTSGVAEDDLDRLRRTFFTEWSL